MLKTSYYRHHIIAQIHWHIQLRAKDTFTIYIFEMSNFIVHQNSKWIYLATVKIMKKT